VGVTTGDVEGIGIAIGTGAKAEVTVLGDLHYYPVRLQSPLRQLFAPLIEDRVALFAGRADGFARIARFIADPAGGYLVITAPAGFGKTALIANLVSSTPEAFAYHFFTSTHGAGGLREEFFLGSVVEQLAQRHGRTGELPPGLDERRALYHELTREPLERTQVLVLDGLDEVTDWDLSPYLGVRLPKLFHVIATVRDVGQDWLREYGLPPEQTHELALGGLTRDEVVDVLRAAGAPAADEQTVAAVVRVSTDEAAGDGSDPLFVRILAEDLASGAVGPAGMADRAPGLERYFDEWWASLKASAGDEPTRDLLGTLAAAAGPIARADLEALHPSLTDAWTADLFDDVFERVRRYVVTQPTGELALAHPRFALYLRDRIRIDRYRDGLLAYCREWRRTRSPYALWCYAKHLADAALWDELDCLVGVRDSGEPFPTARYSVEGSDAGFLADLDRAWRKADEAGVAEPSAVAQQARFALVQSSLRSKAANVPVPLIVSLLEAGEWTPETALDHARQLPDPLERSTALGALAPRLPERLRGQVVAEAFDALRAVRYDVRRPGIAILGPKGPAPATQDADLRAAPLVQLAPHLPEDLLDEALVVAREIRKPERRAGALAALAQRLAEPVRTEAVEEALNVARTVAAVGRPPFFTPTGVRRARALALVADYLPAPGSREVLAEALALARSVRPGWRAISAVVAEVLPHLDQVEAVAVVRDLVAQARASGDWRDTLIGALSHLEEEEREAAALDALHVVQAIESEYERAEPLCLLVPSLPKRVRAEHAVEAARLGATLYAPERAKSVVHVGPFLPEPARRAAYEGALDALFAELEDDEESLADDMAEAFGRIASQLPEALLAATVARLSTLRAASTRPGLLAALAPHLPPRLAADALASARTAGDALLKPARLAALEGGDPLPPADEPDELDPQYDDERVIAAVRTLGGLDETARAESWLEAFSAAGEIVEAGRRHRALAAVADALPPLPREALYPLWRDAARAAARRTRRDAVGDCDALAPLIAAVGDATTVRDVVTSVSELYERLP
jgi:hypothetical protein